MAAMDYRRALALAEQLIMAGQNDGLTREALVQQIIAKSQGAGAPQTATGAGLMMPPPRTVTPATPAPMQPGVQLVAPKPVAEAAAPMPEQAAPQRAAPRPSEFRQMLESITAEIGAVQSEINQAVANKQQPDMMAQIRLKALKDQARQIQGRVQAEESASVPEELQAALEGRQARLARREELLAEDKSRAPWEALLAGGAAMAQGRRGERFTEALSRGLQTGLQSYGQSRRANQQGIEGVSEARDQAMIDRFTMQEKAREAAAARVAGMQGMEREARRTAVEDVETPLRLRKGAADVGMAEINLRNAPEMARLDKLTALARIANENRGNRGDGGKVDVERRQNNDELDKAAADYEAARATYNNEIRTINKTESNKTKTPEEKLALVTPDVANAMLSTGAKLRTLNRAYERKYNLSPYPMGESRQATSNRTATQAGAPPVPGARLAPDGKYYVPDPKRPGKYLQVG